MTEHFQKRCFPLFTSGFPLFTLNDLTQQSRAAHVAINGIGQPASVGGGAASLLCDHLAVQQDEDHGCVCMPADATTAVMSQWLHAAPGALWGGLTLDNPLSVLLMK